MLNDVEQVPEPTKLLGRTFFSPKPLSFNFRYIETFKIAEMILSHSKPFFAPELFINNGVKDISFYEKAFGATELRRFSNDDGSIHVAELSIEGAIFHLHEITAKNYWISPNIHNATTVCVGLFVPDADNAFNKAIQAGATVIDAPQDYEYGYRQGTIKDPFGHYWQIQQKI